MSYLYSIKKLNELFLSFITQTTEDFSNKDLQKRLTKQTNSLNYTLFHIDSAMSTKLEASSKQYDEIIENSNKEKEEMFKVLNQEIDAISANFKKQKQEASDDFASKKEQILEQLKIIEQDTNYFNLTTSQTINVLKDEYDDNLRRFEYQIKNANEHYKESIDENNKELNDKLNALSDSYQKRLIKYKEELDDILNSYDEGIEQNEKEYDELRRKLQDVKNITKEKLLQESIALNENIKILSNEKALSIDKAKEKNANSIASFNAQKERLHNDVSLNVKNIQRDFVVNLSMLEDKLVNIKQKNENAIDKETRRYHYELLNINRLQNEELKKLIKPQYSSEGEERNVKKLIKQKNKQHFKMINDAKKKNTTKLKILNLNLQKDIEYNRYKRLLLDLNKNAQLKKASEKEQFKNKAFQEEDNIFEIDLKLAIDTANKKFNQKANIVKTQNQIKNKDLRKDLDLSESNFLKKLEMILTEINTKKIKIEEAKKLYELMCIFEEEKYKKTRQYYIVSSLLETEKGKLLNEYNETKYNQSTENALKLYLYTSNKFELDNKKFESIAALKTKQEDIKLEREQLILDYNNIRIEILEEKAKQLIFRRNQYILNNINHDTLFQRFKVEYDCILVIMNTFSSLLNEIGNYNERILKVLYNTLDDEHPNSKVLSSSRYIKIIMSYYTSLVDQLVASLSEIIYKHSEFEEKFKYRQFYNSLILNYETDNKKHIEKKKRFEETLLNYDKTLDNFTNKIYSCQNEISMISHRLKIATQNKEIYIDQINKNNQLIKELRTKIKDIEKLRKIIIEDIEKTDVEINKLDVEYNDRVEDIKTLQYTNAKAYTTLKKNIDNFTSFSKPIIEKFNFKINSDKFDEDEFIKLCNDTVAKINKQLENELKSITNLFKIKSEERYNLINQNTKSDYIKDCHTIKRKSEFNLHRAKNNHNSKLSNNQQHLFHITNDIGKETDKFNSTLHTLKDRNNFDNKYLLSDQRQKLSDFYNSYNSLFANIQDINKNYEQEIHKLEQNFFHEKNANAKQSEREIIHLNIRLSEFIRSKNELISRLPVILKHESQMLNKENRELNTSISQQIKENVNNSDIQKKIINKNISVINDSLEQSNAEIDKILQKEIAKEKKTFNYRINHFNHELKKIKRAQ